MRFRPILAAVLVLSLPAAVHAQTSTPDTLFARSPWGAEASIANGVGASLMHVRPSGTAWLVSLTANGSTNRVEIGPPLSESQKFTSATAALSFGLRHYRGHGAVRPYLEGGLFGDYGWAVAQHRIGGGVYGEIGAAYFVAPHVTLGVAQVLNLGYSRMWGGDPETRVKSWNATLPNPALRLAVFF